jgi:hypothetical protein
MTDTPVEPNPEPKTNPPSNPQNRAAAFYLWAKGAAPLVTAVGAVLIGLIGIFKKPAEPVATQSYKELSSQVEKNSADIIKNHDDNTILRGYIAALMKQGVPGSEPATAAPTPTALASAAPMHLIPLKPSGGGKAAPATSSVAVLMPMDSVLLKPLPPASPRPSQYSPKPIQQVEAEAEKSR